MMTGLYSSAASLEAYEKRQEASTANLANVSTPGYRRRMPVVLGEMRPGRNRLMGAGMKAPVPRFAIMLDFTPGSLQTTGNPYDLSLTGIERNDGNAFFALAGSSGEEVYARTGRLMVDPDGRLVHTSSGLPFVHPNGSPVRLQPGGGAPKVDERGVVLQDGNEIGQLKIVRFRNPRAVRPLNHGLFDGGRGARPESAEGLVRVKQGHLESSNTSAVDELVGMITNFRSYEATQKVIRQMDQSLAKLIRQPLA
jgi:flagellar basal body rod protein FlgG